MSSALQQWLRSLDEAQIGDWANKGLLRRGSKTLAACDPASWTLEEARASASIEGHQQQLTAVGFAALSCDCPAFGPCHHLTAFLLGLQARLASAPPPVADSSAAPLTPWLDGEADSCQRAFGAPLTRRALGWLGSDCEAVIEMNEGGLVASLLDPEEATVRIPRSGGLAASTCSCKADRCAHRALVLLQLRREAGLPIPPVPEPGLDSEALARLQQLEDWLLALVLQGSSAIGPAFVDQGEALATALRQSDLPRPALALQALVQLLRDDQARRGGAAERLADALAAIWVLVRGLRASPLPRPFRELAGVLRRGYRRRDGLLLRAEGAEVWETLSGFRGFTIYLRELASGDCYRWSEARGREQDAQWQPLAAVRQHARLDGQRAAALFASVHRLDCGWVSSDGRLSARDGTRLQAQPDISTAPEPADPLALHARLREQRLADPWQQHNPEPHWLAISSAQTPVTDSASQRWQLTLTTSAGSALQLRLELDASGRRISQHIEQGLASGRTLAAIFGPLWLEAGQLHLRPVSLRWADSAALEHPSIGTLSEETPR